MIILKKPRTVRPGAYKLKTPWTVSFSPWRRLLRFDVPSGAASFRMDRVPCGCRGCIHMCHCNRIYISHNALTTNELPICNGSIYYCQDYYEVHRKYIPDSLQLNHVHTPSTETGLPAFSHRRTLLQLSEEVTEQRNGSVNGLFFSDGTHIIIDTFARKPVADDSRHTATLEPHG